MRHNFGSLGDQEDRLDTVVRRSRVERSQDLRECRLRKCSKGQQVSRAASKFYSVKQKL